MKSSLEAGGNERELEKYRALVESAGDPMYVVDESGDLEVLNEAMAEFFSCSKASLAGRNIAELLPPSAVVRGEEAVSSLLRHEDKQWESFETWLTDGDGNERLVEATIGTVSADDALTGAVATLRDITERHQRQEELDLIKGIFARSLRHNIRNKASIIEGFATLLADDLEDEQAAMAESILRASNSLARTSEKVADFDWVAETDFEVVEHDLDTVLRKAVREVLEPEYDVTFEYDVPAVTVTGIRDLGCAFENLVENAVEHASTDGPVTLGIHASVRDETVTVAISDDGPGIPQQEVAVIASGQETPLQHGSGLGLWLVDRVVSQSNGTLSFEADGGTTVLVTLERPD
ncbi:MAG: PAS domain-containing sensor histidine kinase [Halovenus sp.]